MARRPALVVEVGPKQVLTKLAKKICSQTDVVFMATDNSARPAELVLADVLAQAECLNCLTPGSAAREPALRGRRGDAQLVVFDATKRRRERMREQSRKHAEIAVTAANASGNGNPNGPASAPTAASGPSRIGGTGGSSMGPLPPTTSYINGSSPSRAEAEPIREITPARVAAPPTVAAESVAQPRAQMAVAASPSTSTAKSDEIRRVLVEFVVEQTGYPEEIIELDADLEADLGIDSIKKAQLFGEVGTHFSIAPRDDLSLDDFPTLGHVLDFLVEELGASSGASVAVAETPVAATAMPAPALASPSVDMAEIRRVLVDFVVEQTGYPEEIIELDADLEADLGIDSIKKAQLFGEVGAHFRIAPRDDLSLDDFPTLGHVIDFLVNELGSSTAGSAADVEPLVDAEVVPAATAVSPSVDTEEIRRVLVDFVVEQTGYPEEIIELDADLEADLGIDSIKKAQLFGEVGSHFSIAPRDDLSLDDFPTLGHVLKFLVGELADSGPVGTSPAEDGRSAQLKPAESTEPPASAVSPVAVSPVIETHDFLRIEALYGTADQRGKQYGETFRQEIESSLASSIDSWEETNHSQPVTWPCALNDGLVAVAEGAGINKEAVIAANNRLEPLVAWPIGFTPGRGNVPAGTGAALKGVVQVHHEVGHLTYLSVNQVGQLHVRAAVNSARLAVSCEPLSAVASATDVVAITGQLHQILAQVNSIAVAQQRLLEVKLQGDWCIGFSDADHPSPEFTVVENGQFRTGCSDRASSQQLAFHENLASGEGKLLVYSRNSSQQMAVDIDLYFKDAPTTADVASAEVMSRHVLRITPAPLPPANARTVCQGQTFFLLGQNEVARMLAQSVVEHGGAAEVFTDAAALLQRMTTETPLHLVLLPFASPEPRELEDDSPVELHDGVFQVCQKWIPALQEQDALANASLSAITRLGGDFGFQASVTDYAGGGLTGLAKGIRREFPALRVKVLDCDDSTTPLEAACNLLEELSSADKELEIAIHSGRRHVVQAIATPAMGDKDIRAGGVWVVTGGGRGVTSVVARELAARYDLKLHLLGTAPAPDANAPWRVMDSEQLKELKQQTAIEARQQGISPADAWRSIEKAIELDENFRLLTEAGIAWQYHCCDVSDRDSLQKTLDTIRREQGPIEGVLHGAGIEAACRFSRKKADVVQATIASKCDGARNLVALTAQDPVRYFISFGSTSGRFGGLGQVDYSLASDLLAKMMGKLDLQRPENRSVCFHWPAWGDVGMAMRAESRDTLEANGLSFMPALEGVEHVIRELTSGESESEVLILDQGGPLDTDGTMTRASAPATVAARTRAKPITPQPTSQPPAAMPTPLSSADVSDYPLIERFSACDESGRHDAVCRLSPTVDPFLLYHRFREMPFLPGVISLEAMAEAARLALPDKQFVGFTDVRFEKGMAFRSDQPLDVTIRMRAHAEGMQCDLVAPFVDSHGQVIEQERIYSSALVLFGQLPQLEPIDPGTPLFGWAPFYYPREIVISHGHPMQSLIQLEYKHGGGRGQIHAGSPIEILGERTPRKMTVASLALDGSMVCCGFFGYCMLETEAGLPHGIQEYRQARLPQHHEHCSLRFFFRESNPTGELYDFVLLGDAGDVIFEVKGYQTASVLETD